MNPIINAQGYATIGMLSVVIGQSLCFLVTLLTVLQELKRMK